MLVRAGGEEQTGLWVHAMGCTITADHPSLWGRGGLGEGRELGLFFLKDKLWRVKFILKNKILLLILLFMCRALESDLVQLMQPTLQVFTRLKNKRLRQLIRAAVIATRQLDCYVNGLVQKEEKTKTTYLEVERHARGGWLLRWAETNLLTDAVCIFDAELDEQDLGQSLIDTVVQKTARRQPKQAAAAGGGGGDHHRVGSQ
jgi:hypothetical protein